MAAPILQPVAPPPRRGNIDPASVLVRGALAVIDFELTGLDPEVDRIVEVGVIWFKDGERRERHTLINPEVPIPPTASAVHHITDADVAAAPTFDKVAPVIRKILKSSTVMAHAAEMDALILGAELGEHIEPSEWICSWRLARHLYPLAPAHGNQELRYWLALDPGADARPHRALGDARTTFELALHLLTDLPAEVQHTPIDLDAVRAFTNRVIPAGYMPFGRFAGTPLHRVPRRFLVRAIGADGRPAAYPHMDVDLRASIQQILTKQEAGHVV